MIENIFKTNLEIAKRVEVPTECPFILVAVAPCRSGTTAQLRVFAEAGVPAHYQPLKAILRDLEQGKESAFRIPEDKPKIFIKETVGPYTVGESTLDPLAILLNAGVPKDRIHLIPMLRQPMATFASWIKVNQAVERFFGGAIPTDDLLSNLITSYETVEQIRQQALDLGIPTTTFVQESLRDNSPIDVVESLLNKTGLSFNKNSVEGWRSLPQMGSMGSNIIFHPVDSEPEKDEGAQIIHKILLNSDGLQYIAKEDNDARIIQPEQRRRLLGSRLGSIYEGFRGASEIDLGLKIKPFRV